MYSSYGEHLRKWLVGQRIAKPEYIWGCTEEEIEAIKLKQNVKRLPEVYRQFFLTMGHSTGGWLFQGSDSSCNDLLYLKEGAKHLLELHGNPFELPEDAFVFFMHQGYMFLYFHTENEDDNPPVFSFHEGEGLRPIQKWKSMTELFEAEIRALVLLRKKNEPLA